MDGARRVTAAGIEVAGGLDSIDQRNRRGHEHIHHPSSLYSLCDDSFERATTGWSRGEPTAFLPTGRCALRRRRRRRRRVGGAGGGGGGGGGMPPEPTPRGHGCSPGGDGALVPATESRHSGSSLASSLASMSEASATPPAISQPAIHPWSRQLASKPATRSLSPQSSYNV